MVTFWIVLFTAARASVIDFALIPFGQWAGIQKKQDRVRFAEQGWLLVYYIIFWPLGVVSKFMSQSHCYQTQIPLSENGCFV